jgi:hypothetical protein
VGGGIFARGIRGFSAMAARTCWECFQLWQRDGLFFTSIQNPNFRNLAGGDSVIR